MSHRLTRGWFIAAAAGSTTLASIGVIPSPARAAQFEYKLAHGTTTDFPLHIRAQEAADAIRKETGGRLNITIFPNNILGSEIANIGQIRSNTIQFCIIPSLALGTAVPGLGMDGLGFAFKDAEAVNTAFDGALGQYLTGLIAGQGIHPFPKMMNLGMREVTSSSHPIRNAADFAGFKIRTQPGQIAVDMFRTLGASPTPIVFPELYTAMQTHVVDGQETPYVTIDESKFYEVQKYLSVTNHMATIFWPIANMDAWNALPPDIQEIVAKHFDQAAVLERRDTVIQSNAHADKLRAAGMVFNTADGDSMRAQLKPFYQKWKSQFSDSAWALMERTTGKLV
jgi:tripartite ATP-independent transporter DctP family solute receptor